MATNTELYVKGKRLTTDFEFDEAAKQVLMKAASLTRAGKIEIATDAEAIAGTDALRAVTPAGLRAVINSLPAGSDPNAVVTTGSYSNPAWITSLDGSKISGSVSSASNADTVTNGLYSTGSYSNPSWLTSIAGSKVTGSISGNAGTATSAGKVATTGWTVEEVGGAIYFKAAGVNKAKLDTSGNLSVVGDLLAFQSLP